MKSTKTATTILSIVFFFSGFASLMYQVAWQRLLTVHYGVGAIATTLIVSVYMLGLGVGALLGGFLSERVINKIKFYFIVELLMGGFGLISLPFLNYLGNKTAGSSYMVSLACMFLFLCLPTLLMGITLPLLTKIFNGLIRNFIRSISFLYFINTLGAAVGAIFAGYFVITFFGLDTTVYMAVLINFVLAILILGVNRIVRRGGEQNAVKESSDIGGGELGRLAYVCVFVTGFLAIGYELAWFRVVGVLIKCSPYGFATMLSVYLFGLALGSYGMDKFLDRRLSINRKALFFNIQFLIGLYVLLSISAYYYLSEYTAFGWLTKKSFATTLHPSLFMLKFKTAAAFFWSCFSVGDVVFWPVLFFIVPTVLMGASFPLISSLALSRRDKEGMTVGTVYFLNVIGNVFGGIVTGFLLLPLFGSEHTLSVFAITGIFFLLFVSNRTAIQKGTVIAVCLLIAVFVFPGRGELYRMIHTAPEPQYKAHMEEGVDGVVLTYEKGDRIINYVNGTIQGVRPGYIYIIETIKAIAHAPKSGNVLIIGFGTGSSAEVVLKSEVEKITLVELSSTMINNLRKNSFLDEILNDKKMDVIVEDGRRYLLSTQKKFDLILIDPIGTRQAYSNNLYSQRFFELVRDHLKEDGVFLVWMDEVQVMPRTVASVFKHVKMYPYYSLFAFCLASESPLQENLAIEKNILSQFSLADQEEIVKRRNDLLGRTYTREEILQKTREYPVNKDWKPYCEYYLRWSSLSKLNW